MSRARTGDIAVTADFGSGRGRADAIRVFRAAPGEGIKDGHRYLAVRGNGASAAVAGETRFCGAPWLKEIERELLAIIDQPRMKGATVVGTSGGGYFAARLGLLRPKQVRSVVLVNALVHTTVRALSDPDAPASWPERLARVKTAVLGPQLFPVAPIPPQDEFKRLVDDPQSMHSLARNWMAFAVKDNA